MLGKLLKHEFRATARIMWVLYAAMLVLSVGMHFAIRYMQGSLSDPADPVHHCGRLLGAGADLLRGDDPGTDGTAIS